MKRILIVDDAPTLRKLINILLENEDYECTDASDAAEARRLLKMQPFDLILCDINMPGESGLDFVRFTLAEYTDTAVIMITGMASRQIAAEALSIGAYGYLIKPFDKIQLLIAMDNAFRRLTIEKERIRHIEELDILVQERTVELQENIQKLKNSEERLRTIMENVPAGIVVIETQSRTIVEANRSVIKILGRPRREFIGASCHEIICKGNATFCPLIDKNRSLHNHESIIQRPDGSSVPIMQTAVPVILKGKNHLINIFVDITEQKLAKDKYLQENKEKKQLMESIPSILIGVSKEDKVIQWNLAAEATLGIRAMDVMGIPFTQCGISWDWSKLEKGILSCKMHKSQVRLDNLSFTKPDGSEGFLGITLAPMASDNTEDTDKIGFIFIAADITALKQARSDLHQSEMRHRILFESSQDAILTLEPPSWRFTSCNQATLKLFNVADKKAFTSLYPWEISPELQPDGTTSKAFAMEHINRAMECGSIFFEYMHKKYNEDVFFPATILLTRMELPGKVLLQGTVRDISEQKSLEVQLMQARKLEAVGQLAAGIAHEINTPIQYVGDNNQFMSDAFEELLEILERYQRLEKHVKSGMNCTELLQDISDAVEQADMDYLKEEIPKAMEQTLEGVNRISEIVRSMKEFSHPGVKEKVAVDINRAIENTLTVSRNEWKYMAEIETDLAPSLPLIPCLPGELNQVFLNIIINAAHAIGDVVNGNSTEKGRIGISTRIQGEYLEIRISDTGPGIPEEIRSRIFDPFFTTKEVGKGTGQGLAISRSIIVEKHHGILNFETAPQKGSTFIIHLPIHEKSI